MRRLPALLFLCLGLCMADGASAQEVHRCLGADGSSILTDRRCVDVGAIERAPPAADAPAADATRAFHDSCARTLSSLVQRITSAIASGDVNQLAGIYEWSSVSDAGADRVLDRLESIVQHPLVAILPIRPVVETADADIDADADTNTDAPVATRQPHPIGLRLEQTQADGHTPAHAEFDLSRRYGCFWIRL